MISIMHLKRNSKRRISGRNWLPTGHSDEQMDDSMRWGERFTRPLITSQQSFLDLCWATCDRVNTFALAAIVVDSKVKAKIAAPSQYKCADALCFRWSSWHVNHIPLWQLPPPSTSPKLSQVDCPFLNDTRESEHPYNNLKYFNIL